MAVSFEDAVATLHGMFSSYDRDTLGRILTQNNYHMVRPRRFALRPPPRPSLTLSHA